MLKLCVVLWLLISGLSSDRNMPKVFEFQQNDYDIEFERFVLDHVNEKYVKSAKVTTFKYNRTTPVVNATFAYKVDLGNHPQIVVQAYKFMSNEYRYFPLRFQVNICDALSKNLIGIADTFKCGNFTGCPIQKNRIYHVCHWTIDKTQFPPLIPNGRYMVELQALYLGEDVGSARLYATVYRPVPII